MAVPIEASSVKSLIESTRRRLHLQALSSQALVALSIGAGGLVLLLILGTQVLNWYWPLLLGAASFGYLVYRVWNKLPGSYQSAQILDQRLRTHDLFSSAHHFLGQPVTRLSESLIATADNEARSVSAALAVPFHMPSGWARAAGLAVAALSLLVFRYAFQSSLDLGQPIAPGLYQLFASGEKPRQVAKSNQKNPDGSPMEGFGLTETSQQRAEEKGLEKGQELSTESSSSTESAEGGQKPGQFQQSMSPSEEGEKMEGAEKGDSAGGGDKNQQGDAGDKDGGKKSDGADKKSAAQQKSGDQQGDKSSLMDKFKDAMANMMNKMKSQDKSQGEQQQSQNNKKDSQQGKGQQQQSDKGQQSQGKEQAGGQQQNDPNGQQQGEGNEKSPNQQAKGGDKSNQPSNGDNKSGTGKQDGSKDIQIAEQQKAMGKISEVFGKRAQNLQGEIMIEVSSSKSQALKTGYSDKTAAHTDSSGVIHRDEVPLIFQNYVQRYFEELRKSPPPAPRATP